MSRLLAVDVGERRIGLAMADTETGKVRPLTTLRRSLPERDGAVIARLAREQNASELVVGLPLNMDGSEGVQAARTRAWVDSTCAGIGLPIFWRDERLTSEKAEQRAGRLGRGSSGGPPSAAARTAYRARIDRLAAAAIAQAELDARAAAAETGK